MHNCTTVYIYYITVYSAVLSQQTKPGSSISLTSSPLLCVLRVSFWVQIVGGALRKSVVHRKLSYSITCCRSGRLYGKTTDCNAEAIIKAHAHSQHAYLKA